MTTTEPQELFLADRLGAAGVDLKTLGLVAAKVRAVRVDPFNAGLLSGSSHETSRVSGPCAGKEPSFAPYYEWTVTITDEGRKLGINGPELETATAEFVEITGLSKDQQSGLTTAEYTFRWKVTPIAERVAKLAQVKHGALLEAFFPKEEQQKAVAAFRLYDDGWRLTK